MVKGNVIPGLDLDSDLQVLLDSWESSLRAQGRRSATIQSYRDAVRLFDEHLASHGMPRSVVNLTREHVESHIAWLMGNRSPSTAGIRYRSLRVFFGWCVDQGEIKASPMARMKPPTIDEVPKQIYTQAELDLLLRKTRGDTSFLGRRDYALMMVLASTGMRRGELANLATDAAAFERLTKRVTGDNEPSGYVDWEQNVIALHRTKGRKLRLLHLYPNVRRALVRYMQGRQQRKRSGLGWLWLSDSGRVTHSERGRLTTFGVAQALKRRCADAGVPYLAPHSWRHQWVTRNLARMSDASIAVNAGWSEKSAHAMLSRYSRYEASEAARAEAAESGWGGDLE